MASKIDKSILKDAKVCPFCKQKPRAMVMLGHLGFCCYVGCENKECLVNPKTGMINAKTEGRAIKLAREAWQNRNRK